MTLELMALLGTSITLFFAIFAQQIAIDRKYGAKYALSNREELPSDSSPTVERLTRLVRNHVEGVAVFAPLVLIAASAGVSNAYTQYAATGIFVLRFLHFVFYALGITPFRSFAWGLGFLIATPVFLYGLISGAVQ